MADRVAGPALSVCRVDESNWQVQKRLRLAMLQQAPRAYATTYAEAAARRDEEWIKRSRTLTTFLVMRGEEAFGTVGMGRWPDQPPDETSLVGMWVEPAARGRGVGELLVRTVLDEAERRGVRRVTLDVAHENTPAIRLYERLGFTPTGRTGVLDWDPSITELEMEYLLRRHETNGSPGGHLPSTDGPSMSPPTVGAMSEITVRALTEDEWEQYRSIRLSALEESPQAFVATHAEEAAYDEDRWRQRMRRSLRLLAEADGTPVGVASVGDTSADTPGVAQLFGLWVAPTSRGTGVATRLVQEGADQARARGKSHLAYWVGTDNGRAVAFASGFGFRPTDDRRPMRVQSEEDGAEEIAMLLPLGEDRY